MKYAYADPPYIGCAKRYPEKQEVDHGALLRRLCSDYDGWALSCSTPSLRYLLPLCPEETRVMAWVKPFAVFKPNVNPGYTWEPLLVYGARTKRSRSEATVRDWVSAGITLKTGLVGAKPRAFCNWLFDALGLLPDDTIDDLYPGTGIVTRTLAEWRDRYKLLIPADEVGR